MTQSAPRQLDWTFHTGHNATPTTRTSVTIRYGQDEVLLQDLTEKTRKGLVNLLISLEKALKESP